MQIHLRSFLTKFSFCCYYFRLDFGPSSIQCRLFKQLLETSPSIILVPVELRFRSISSLNKTSKQNMEYLNLNDGNRMPVVGYGTWQSRDKKELEDAVDVALKAGYRHFDTAYAYGNETILGKVFSKWIEAGKIKREDLYIVTKLPIQGTNPDRVDMFMKLSLKNLGMDYVDMFLIHFPAGLQATSDGLNILMENGRVKPDIVKLEDVWKSMENQVKEGRAKSIGLSNFSIEQVERIVKSASIIPACHQVELNVYYQKKPLQDVMNKYNIKLCAYAPLGSPGRKAYYEKSRPNNAHLKVFIPPLLDHPIITNIANKRGVTAAQVLLRFLTQKGIAVIPKSLTPERIRTNLNVFGFELDKTEIKDMEELDSGVDGTWGFDWLLCSPGLEDHPEFKMVPVTVQSVTN